MSLPFERLGIAKDEYGYDLDQEVCAAKEDSKELEKEETLKIPRAKFCKQKISISCCTYEGNAFLYHPLEQSRLASWTMSKPLVSPEKYTPHQSVGNTHFEHSPITSLLLRSS
jgi:hypothetical protein